MRDLNVHGLKRALPRMSWDPQNLYNLWRRSQGPLAREAQWKDSTRTVFQQRWIAKRLVRAYHGDFLNEKIFKRWYLPATLPDVRPRKGKAVAQQSVLLGKWAKKDHVAESLEKRQEEEDEKGLAPVGSLMFSEIERRIDVVIFRACMAHSVYEARRLVIHGNVLLNGKKHTNANTRLAPGDMVTVDPKAIRFLQKSAAPKEEVEDRAETSEQGEEASELGESEMSQDEARDAEATETAAFEGKSLEAATTEQHTSSKPEVVQSASLSSRPKEKSNLTPFHPPPYSAPFMFIPAYIEVSFLSCSAIYLRHPTARPNYSEIPTPYDADGEVVRLAWEWYSRTRPRIRSKSQVARMPENRQ